MMPIGARVHSGFQRPDPALVAQFAGLPSCDVSDAAGKFYVADAGIKRVGGPGGVLVGPAVTVHCRPDDNLMIHAAIDLAARPGDVIVVSAGGGLSTALVGELVTLWARKRGVAGFVVDGAVRDCELLAVPAFARGTTPRAPSRQAAGEVGYPVGIGGVGVHPGDIIVADSDGVVVVPQQDAAGVLARAKAVREKDFRSRTDIDAGTYDRSWLAGALKAAGVTADEEEAE